MIASIDKVSPQPQLLFEDPRLGHMAYSEEDENWVGNFNGFEFRIAYEQRSSPDPALLDYCQRILSDADFLTSALVEQQELKKGCHGGLFDDEINALQFLNVMFYRAGGNKRILVQLAPLTASRNASSLRASADGFNNPIVKTDERLWRMEFNDDYCTGLDFDY